MSKYEIKELPFSSESPFDTFLRWYNQNQEVEVNPISDAEMGEMNLRNVVRTRALQEQQLAETSAWLSIADSFQYRDASIMMEGPLDHHAGGKPTEYFMSPFIHPYKLGIVARFTAIGWRICYEFAQDCWAGGLGIRLIGENIKNKEREVNILLKQHFREINFMEKMELATGFAREQGHSLIVLYYEGEKAATVGPTEKTTESLSNAFQYMQYPAPDEKRVVKLEAFNRQYYYVSKDDGKGNPLEFTVSIFLGKFHGKAQIRIHHSRCIWVKRTDVERNFEAHSVIEPCYNELIILTNILKACGEIAFRWGTGHPVILTKGLNPTQAEVFKRLLGNPIRKDWHVFPSEMIEAFDLISQKSGMVDLPALGDWTIGLVVASTSIPRPILMGEVSGVVTGGEVNERSYYALLDKEHSNLESPVFEFFEKDAYSRSLLFNLTFEFDWGIRQTMSEKEQMDVETKKLANIVTKLQFLPFNQCLNELGYPPLEQMVEGEFRDYARFLGNSILSFTLFDMQQMMYNFQLQKQQIQQRTLPNRDPTANRNKGKGEGVKWGEGKQPKDTPMNYQRSKAANMSMVKNKVGVVMSAFRKIPEFESIPKLCRELGISPTTYYKIEGWGNGQ